MLIVTGDMNAKVREQNMNYKRMMGKHGLAVKNDNGVKAM